MTILSCLKETTKLLSSALDAKLIVLHFCNINETDLVLHPEREISDYEYQEIKNATERRLNKEPIAYITGERAFYKSYFKTNPNVLIPQPDTETLVEHAVLYAKDKILKDITILDLCAGTGCIGISVAKEISSFTDHVNLFLSDISKSSYDCFCENSKNLISEKNISVFFNHANLFENLKENSFDMILTNPPYIPTQVIKTLDQEVQFEPLVALDGGSDGLSLIKEIIKKAPLYLKEKSVLMMEIGYDQGLSVPNLFKEHSFTDIEVYKDLGMLNRVVKGINK